MAAAKTPLLAIEVAYASPAEQLVQRLAVPPGTTLEQAVARSGLIERFGELAAAPLRLGVFGRLRDPQEPVCAGDRVEIYRALLTDPKEARRRRASRKAGRGAVRRG